MDKILEALKAFLKDGTDVKAVEAAITEPLKAINPLEGVTVESVGTLLSKQPALKAAFDRKVEETTKKWAETNFDRLYQERFTKEHPEADPTKKEVQELKRQLEAEQALRRKKELHAAALLKAKELGLPDEAAGVLDRFLDDDEEKTFANLQKLAWIPAKIQKTVEEQLKDKFRSTPPKAGTPPGFNPWKKDQFNLTKQGELLKTDPALAEKLKVEAQGA